MYSKSVKRTLTISVLLLFLGGCGYSSEEECRVKEMQKCDSAICELEARNYCDSEFPGKTKRYIYSEQNYPANWVRINVDSYRVNIKATKPRYETVKVCIDKAWTVGKGKCKSVRLNLQNVYPKGQSWSYKDSGADTFHSYIDYENGGNEFKEGTTVTVYLRESVGFFRYYFGWMIYLAYLFYGLLILGLGFSLIMWLLDKLGFLDDEENEETEEEDEEVDIPDRAELESMTKGEIKEWTDAFELNLPSSLNKAEMIERFIEETEVYVESSESYDWEWVFAVIIGGLIGWYVLLPFLEYLIY